MELDRYTKNRLGFAPGCYNKTAGEFMAHEQTREAKSEQTTARAKVTAPEYRRQLEARVTNKARVSEQGAEQIAVLLQAVQNGLISMAQATDLINLVK